MAEKGIPRVLSLEKKKKIESRKERSETGGEKNFLSFFSFFLGVGRGEGIVAIAAPSVTLGLL